MKKAFFFQFSPFGVALGLLIILPGEKGSESDKTTYLETIKIENINIKAVDKKKVDQSPKMLSIAHRFRMAPFHFEATFSITNVHVIQT